MPCNAKVVLSAKVNVNDLNKLSSPYTTKLPNGNYQLNKLVSLEVDPEGNATVRYTGDNWDEGLRMLSNAISYLRGLKVEVTDVGKPETHRHDTPQAYAQTGVAH